MIGVIITSLSLVLFLTFMVLGGFHFYWLFGGKWGVEQVIPTKGDGTDTQAIPRLATLMVGLVLVMFGTIYFIKSGCFAVQMPNWLGYSYWFIPSVFVLRAIGEFNYVGFFKKIKHTEFARADSKIFTPLCLGIGLIGLFVQFVSNQLI